MNNLFFFLLGVIFFILAKKIYQYYTTMDVYHHNLKRWGRCSKKDWKYFTDAYDELEVNFGEFKMSVRRLDLAMKQDILI